MKWDPLGDLEVEIEIDMEMNSAGTNWLGILEEWSEYWIRFHWLMLKTTDPRFGIYKMKETNWMLKLLRNVWWDGCWFGEWNLMVKKGNELGNHLMDCDLENEVWCEMFDEKWVNELLGRCWFGECECRWVKPCWAGFGLGAYAGRVTNNGPGKTVQRDLLVFECQALEAGVARQWVRESGEPNSFGMTGLWMVIRFGDTWMAVLRETGEWC